MLAGFYATSLIAGTAAFHTAYGIALGCKCYSKYRAIYLSTIPVSIYTLLQPQQSSRFSNYLEKEINETISSQFYPVLRIRIHKIRMVLGLPDPDPSIIKQK
jgi:hypothetical protein